MLKKAKNWLIGAVIVIALVMVSLVMYKTSEFSPVFLTIHSPKRMYTISLVGQKERPILFTNEVRFNVLKNEEPFWIDQYLHSGDSFDLSFEAAYPNYRWLSENIIHFYREENFTEGIPTEATLTNRTTKVIKYMKLESQDKFLMFDIQPETETTLKITPPKGDYPGVKIEGIFDDGSNFRKEAVFKVSGKLNIKLTYHIIFTNGGIEIESPFLDNNL